MGKRSSDITNCEECTKPFSRTATQRKRGKRFCCWDCYLKGRAREFEAAVAGRKCANDDCDRTDVAARGLCNGCYQQWNARFGKSAKWQSKQCPTCGVEFPTHTDRKFCSLDCYTSSDIFAEARQRYSEKAEAARVASECLQCGKSISVTNSLAQKQEYADGKKRNAKRFCGRACYREYFASRFDRMVASYTALQMPCSYDEFLSQSELPCLLEDCDWIGKNLAIHCNHAHGIDASTLKSLAGFNRSTGVVGADTQRALSERQSGRQKGEKDFYLRSDPVAMTKARGPMRPEGKEHHTKAAKMR